MGVYDGWYWSKPLKGPRSPITDPTIRCNILLLPSESAWLGGGWGWLGDAWGVCDCFPFGNAVFQISAILPQYHHDCFWYWLFYIFQYWLHKFPRGLVVLALGSYGGDAALVCVVGAVKIWDSAFLLAMVVTKTQPSPLYTQSLPYSLPWLLGSIVWNMLINEAAVFEASKRQETATKSSHLSTAGSSGCVSQLHCSSLLIYLSDLCNLLIFEYSDA